MELSAPSTTVATAVFSTASLSPVRADSITNRSRAVMMRASAGTMSPAERRITSPGDELIEGYLDALAVAQGGAGVGDQVLEGLCRIAAACFLDKLHAARYQ